MKLPEAKFKRFNHCIRRELRSVMTCFRALHVMFNLKMEPRWNSEIGQVLQSNAKEDKKLKLETSRINTARKEQLGKIDQEMMSLRKQLLEDCRLFGTRSDIKKREDRNANILEDISEERQVRNSVQQKLVGLEKPEVIDCKSFKPFQERARHKLAVEQHGRKLSPSRLFSAVHEGSGTFRRNVAVLGKLSPSCSTPANRHRSRRHSTAEINFTDTLRKLSPPHTNSGTAPNNVNLSRGMMGGKVDHPLLRQRRASLPNARKQDRAVDLPKLKPIKLVPEEGLSMEESRGNHNAKLGNFSRHVDNDLRWKRRNSLPNFDNFPSNKDSSMACKERLTARLVSRAKPGSASNRNRPLNKRASIFGRTFKKNTTPVTERSNEGDWNEQDNSDSLDRISLVEDNDDKEQDPATEQQLSSEQELSFIPKATLQEKINKFFLDWVEGSDEEPRTDIEELLQEFRKEKKKERKEFNEQIGEEGNTVQETSILQDEPNQ